MREILVQDITNAVKEACIESNCILKNDVYSVIEQKCKEETSELGKDILSKLIENADYAKKENIAICQDTGMMVVFAEIGQDVHIIGGSLEEAINEGVRQGYEEGYLRKSVVAHPINRVNTNDNTPAIIHYKIVPGRGFKLRLCPKGFGSENMSALKMLVPADGEQGVIDFVLQTVKNAGSNPCPPIVVGVGVGGTMEKAAIMAKEALSMNLDDKSQGEYEEKLEKVLLKKINELGIGPQGLGGDTTALKVRVKTYPTHIAGLPVAVNINCHVTRHSEVIL
ncbi:hydro-lyase, Fe-S type, tartrate/fumarate subfamily, alpha subunit [Clostridium bornimense]|uniref:Hydro-lyase, Fe-S type, tartrate/fumarate subfamily, alpha subunit n=1 Tax=Clostridium bornimense TaxID=1216932 RepID=W6SC68_9CLOT|nr:fumarate hydratase [Clostridium bornimense]CDM67220.1 hydro-lyase, Fe-S type, tartrate/fumarate subfamily, alpha subunit [Clostridium bornimense]